MRLTKSGGSSWLKHCLVHIVLGFSILLVLQGASFASNKASTVAVMTFENKSTFDRLDYFEKIIPQILTSHLAQMPELQALERRHVESLLSELDMTPASLADPATRQTAGKALGADFLITGQFSEKFESGQEIKESILSIFVEVLELENNRITKQITVRGECEQIIRLVKEIAEGLSSTLTGHRCEQAFAPDPETEANFHYARFKMYSFLANRGFSEEKSVKYGQQAIASLQRAIYLGSQNTSYRFELARYYSGAGPWYGDILGNSLSGEYRRKAIQVLADIVKLFPCTEAAAIALHKMGLVYFAQNIEWRDQDAIGKSIECLEKRLVSYSNYPIDIWDSILLLIHAYKYRIDQPGYYEDIAPLEKQEKDEIIARMEELYQELLNKYPDKKYGLIGTGSAESASVEDIRLRYYLFKKDHKNYYSLYMRLADRRGYSKKQMSQRLVGCTRVLDLEGATYFYLRAGAVLGDEFLHVPAIARMLAESKDYDTGIDLFEKALESYKKDNKQERFANTFLSYIWFLSMEAHDSDKAQSVCKNRLSECEQALKHCSKNMAAGPKWLIKKYLRKAKPGIAFEARGSVLPSGSRFIVWDDCKRKEIHNGLNLISMGQDKEHLYIFRKPPIVMRNVDWKLPLIYCLPKNAKAFSEYVFKKDCPPGTIINSIAADKDDVWFATIGTGVMHYNKEKKEWRTYTLKEGLAHNDVHSLVLTPKFVWLSVGDSQRAALCKLEKETGKIYTYVYPAISQRKSIFWIEKDGETIWAFSKYGPVMHFSTKTEQWEKPHLVTGHSGFFKVICGEDSLWFSGRLREDFRGTCGGIVKLDGNLSKGVCYFSPSQKEKVLEGLKHFNASVRKKIKLQEWKQEIGEVITLFHHNGNFWVATRRDDSRRSILYRWIPASNEFMLIAGCRIDSEVIDNRGDAWVTSRYYHPMTIDDKYLYYPSEEKMGIGNLHDGIRIRPYSLEF